MLLPSAFPLPHSLHTANATSASTRLCPGSNPLLCDAADASERFLPCWMIPESTMLFLPHLAKSGSSFQSKVEITVSPKVTGLSTDLRAEVLP